MIGPLAAASEPHSWDLCESHAQSITAPLGWELVRYDLPTQQEDDDHLTALAEAVREAGRNATGLVLREETEPTITVKYNSEERRSLNPSRHPSARPSLRAHLHVVPDLEDNE